MDRVNRIRLGLAAWYAALTTALMLALIAMLFVLLVRNRSRELDASLQESAHDVVHTASGLLSEIHNEQEVINSAVSDLTSDDVPIYVFDEQLRYHGTPAPPRPLAPLVRSALKTGTAKSSFVVEGQRWRVLLERFHLRGPDNYIVAAMSDETELEQRYVTVAKIFALGALIGILLIGFSAYYLTGRAIRPIQSNVEAMRRFMADAAHELRTPVATVRTHAEVELKRAPHDEETDASLRTILNESGRLTALVGDLLTLARVDSGERVLQRERVYLDDIVSDATAGVSVIAREKGIRLAQGKYEQAAVVGDPRLLRQLVTILLDNALKFTEAGGEICVDVFAENESAIARVSDTGFGISSTDIPHVFDRFFRSEQARTLTSGAGLGLSIARFIVEAHGGQIVVTSTVGKGSSFEARLPLTS